MLYEEGMHSTYLLELKDTQCFLMNNTECIHNFCLVEKLNRAP